MNEEDHARVISMQKGGAMKEVFARFCKGVQLFEKQSGNVHMYLLDHDCVQPRYKDLITVLNYTLVENKHYLILISTLGLLLVFHIVVTTPHNAQTRFVLTACHNYLYSV